MRRKQGWADAATPPNTARTIPPQKDPARVVRNRLLQPDARWQRFQRYVWDRKRG